tara:strand:- start:178 stop:600 length:423 start_codon:yes stop_codon:yes gene_type:complete
LIYLSLFIFCLSLGTFFPFASETYLATLLLSEKYNVILLLLFSSLGNILGSVLSWTFGYFINFFLNKSWFPINKYLLQKAADIFKKYGKWSLLLSWVPFIGDPIAFAAGTFRYNILFFLIFVSIGKVARYLLIYFYFMFI